jgi:hypothetical protein
MRGGRHHHVAGRHVGHAQHAFEHQARLGLDQLAVFGVGQGPDQFGLAVRAGRDEGSTRRLEEGPLVGKPGQRQAAPAATMRRPPRDHRGRLSWRVWV